MQRVNSSELGIEPIKGDRNCCTVLAWAAVFGCNVDKADKYLRRFGRKWRKGMLTYEIEDALKHCKRYKVVKGPYSSKKRVTLKRFTQEHSVGRYYVLVRGHALAVIDGVVVDHTDKPRRQVTGAYRVYSPQEVTSD